MRTIVGSLLLTLTTTVFIISAFHTQVFTSTSSRTIQLRLSQSIIKDNTAPNVDDDDDGYNHNNDNVVNSRSNGSIRNNPATVEVQGAVMPDGGLSPCVIKVIGVGGGGSNAIDRMMETRVAGVEFWAVNTDAQALGRSRAKGASVLNVGSTTTRGLGAGGIPDVGRLAAEESREEIAAMVAGSDLVFVTAGMGGGTGSGAAPVVAEVAKECGALTVGIVTKPFLFEGRRRMNQATQAIENLKKHVDTVIVVSNNKLLEIIPENTPIERSFAVADDILRQGVVGISEIIVKPGLINVDFADVRSVMNDAGTALMGIGTGSGKTRAEDAAMAAISSPLLDSPIDQASGIVFNISGSSDMTLPEINRAAEIIYDSVEENANIIFGALIDDSLEGTMSITVLATGFAFVNDDDTSTSRKKKVSSDSLKKYPAGTAAYNKPPVYTEPREISAYKQEQVLSKNIYGDNNTNSEIISSPTSGSGNYGLAERQLQSSAIPPPPPHPVVKKFESPSATSKEKITGSEGKSGSGDDGRKEVPAFLKSLKRKRSQ